MEPAVSIRLESDSDSRGAVAELVRDVLRTTRCTVQSETEDSEDEHGMLELEPMLMWLATTASGFTATVLGAMIYDALRAAGRDSAGKTKDRTEMRVTRRSVEILDPISGARITISEDTTEIRGR